MKLDNITNINSQTIYQFQKLELEKINSVTELFNSSRNRNIPYSFFRNKYSKKALNCKAINAVIQDDNQFTVGHLGVLPEEHCIDNQIILGGQISDAVLAQELRGKNMFTHLIKHTETLAQHSGIKFLWVAPSPQAVKGFEENNWIKFDTIKQFTFKVRTLPLNKISNKFKLRFFYEFYIRLILFLFCKKTNSIKNPFTKLDQEGIITDDNYVKQKNYTRNYLIKRDGFKFWIKIEDGLEIGNIGYFEKDQRSSLLKTTRTLSRLLGCHQIKIITSEKCFIYKRLENHPSVSNIDLYFKTLSDHLNLDNLVINGSDLNTF